MSARRHSHVRLAGFAVFCCAAVTGLAPAQASAFGKSPQWSVSVVSGPTNFAPGDHSGKDAYTVRVTNTGDSPSDGSAVTIADTLPAGLVLDPAGVSGVELLSKEAVSCVGLTCTFAGVVPVDDTITLTIPVDVEATAQPSETDMVGVLGGGAPEASANTTTTISAAAAGFGIVPGSFSIVPSTTQAGAHADVTASFYLNTAGNSAAGGHTRTIVVDLPSGFAGDPNAMPTCNQQQLLGKGSRPECPASSQVGTISLPLYLMPGSPVPVTEPVYNMETAPGSVAVWGFNVSGIVVQNFYVTLRPDASGLEVTVPDIQGSSEIEGSMLTIWGVPADPVHDPVRGLECFFYNCSNGGQTAGVKAQPYASNPTECTQSPLTATIKLNSWEQPGQQQSGSAGIGPLTGCERLEFDPGIAAQLTTESASAATGLNVTLSIPQSYGDPVALATSHLKDVTVTLPQGMTVNPSAGAGLGACTPAEYAAETLHSLPGDGCPNNSSLGTVTIRTPVLREEATGQIYLAQPYNNPFGSLLAIYVVARIPPRGVIVKVAGKVTPDPLTGQLVTSFEDNPQLPFNEFVVGFRQGQTSPLVSPPACGSYAVRAVLTSWSEPLEVFNLASSFSITKGVGGDTCPSGSIPPFAPQVASGTLDNNAGSYSPFYLRIIRGDGEQEITKFSTILPPGLSGNLSGVPFCPEAAIEAARHKTGAQELNEASCPAASEIGHTIVGAGVGSVLAQAPGRVYLAGPYHGSALSLVSVTSATVGPFDLGTVVIRFALRINPTTAQVEVDSSGSDPIPHIIDGIVVHVRDIRVYINRNQFILNPTSCNPMSIMNTVTGAGADFTNPADGVSVTLTTPFQVADCSSLAFKPTFKVSATGKTSRANGAGLTVKVSYPNAPLGTQANIAKVKVNLPKQLPSRLTTLQKACPDTVFNQNPAACQPASRVGRATATTPIIPVSLSGPAYFVSHGGAKFPELIIVLSGYGITVQLHGDTFINKAGITSSTFRTIPDVPIGTFELRLPQGPDSALAANGNLCTSKLVMPTTFVAASGMTIHQSTPIAATECGKKKGKKPSKYRKKK
jgi:uncharacterized repeat protein (TIGR01451 family)